MTSTAFAPVLRPQRSIEDPLAYLPCSPIVEYGKSKTIYDRDAPSNDIYLILSGKVKVSRCNVAGRTSVIDIYKTDEFFGENSILETERRSDGAVAFENTRVMSWTMPEIEDISIKKPNLAIAFLQLLVQRSHDFTTRIESFAVDNIARRLAHALIRFSERFGSLQGDGSTEMMTLTHEFLAQYVGTSREIVTQYMNLLRRQGYVQYSRKRIHIRQDALRLWLSPGNLSYTDRAS